MKNTIEINSHIHPTGAQPKVAFELLCRPLFHQSPDGTVTYLKRQQHLAHTPARAHVFSPGMNILVVSQLCCPSPISLVVMGN